MFVEERYLDLLEPLGVKLGPEAGRIRRHIKTLADSATTLVEVKAVALFIEGQSQQLVMRARSIEAVGPELAELDALSARLNRRAAAPKPSS